jgi:hypothetical protein
LVREQLEMSYRGRYQSACFADGGWVVQRIEITSPTKEQQDALSRVAGR